MVMEESKGHSKSKKKIHRKKEKAKTKIDGASRRAKIKISRKDKHASIITNPIKGTVVVPESKTKSKDTKEFSKTKTVKVSPNAKELESTVDTKSKKGKKNDSRRKRKTLLKDGDITEIKKVDNVSLEVKESKSKVSLNTKEATKKHAKTRTNNASSPKSTKKKIKIQNNILKSPSSRRSVAKESGLLIKSDLNKINEKLAAKFDNASKTDGFGTIVAPEAYVSKKNSMVRVDTKTNSLYNQKKKQPSENSSLLLPPCKPILDIQAHRFRIAEYIPRSILRLSSTPNIPGTPSYLAVSREGGSVELLSVDEKWRCIALFEGMKGRDVDAMTWICGKAKSKELEQLENNVDDKMNVEVRSLSIRSEVDQKRTVPSQPKRRLFGASRDGTIFEIDFHRKRHLGVIGSGGGAVFCLESICPCCSFDNKDDECGGYVAAGCEDGSVRIFRTNNEKKIGSDNESSLELISTLPSAGLAVLSLAWKSGPGGSIGGSVIFAGIADGTIRRYDCTSSVKSATASRIHAITTGSLLDEHRSSDMTKHSHTTPMSFQWKSSMRMTVESLGSKTATRIWAIKILDDGTVVSGDSLGHVQFWDGDSGTLTQTCFHNINESGVLDLAIR